MKIEQIDQQTIKVVLTPRDMDSFDITYEEMDYKDPNTKRVILELLHQIKKETSMDFNGGKLFVEAFPYLDGGCVLYICTIPASAETTPKTRQTQKPAVLTLRWSLRSGSWSRWQTPVNTCFCNITISY